MAGTRKILENGADDLGMLGRRNLTVIGQRAGIPTGCDAIAPDRHFPNILVTREIFQDPEIGRRQGARETFDGRRLLKRGFQGIDAGKIEIRGAPLQHLGRLETMGFNRFDESIRKRIDLAGYNKSAVAQVSSCPACDLGQLRGGQLTVLETVEFAVLREGDMVDIEMEPHADGIGRHQIIDIARLIELHLRIACARAESAQNDGRTTALPTDQLANRINFVSGERDDRRTARKACDLLRPRIGQNRHARPADDGYALEETLQNSPHRRRAEKKRLFPPAKMDDAIREDMAAFEIRRKLDLVYG